MKTLKFFKNKIKKSELDQGIRFVSLKKLFLGTSEKSQMISLGNSIELPVLFKRIGWRLVAACFPKRVKVPARMHQLAFFAKYLLQMRKHHGADFTVKYLKACQLAVQKRVADDRIESLRDLVPDLSLPRLSRSRLPRIIPLRDRRSICAGRSSTIRWWLTIFSVYRVISIPGTLKLNTITDPFSGNKEKMERVAFEMGRITTDLKTRFSSLSKSRPEIQLLETASPNFKVSWLGIIKEAHLLKAGGFMDDIRTILAEYDGAKLDLLFRACLSVATDDRLSNLDNKWAKPMPSTVEFRGDPDSIDQWYGLPLLTKEDRTWYDETSLVLGLPLFDERCLIDPKTGKSGYWEKTPVRVGQLSTKLEAAGKIRVFALVDVWTQSVLKPLHDKIFDFLRGLPNDGTHDQHKSVLRASEKALLANQSFGYDLSAATDRLPVFLQTRVLAIIYGSKFADAWEHLLVGRDYVYKADRCDESWIRYAVGQPMGALSSWAMLALTHHLIVQVAAARCGRRPLPFGTDVSKERDPLASWYSNYELLGDDIILFDADVAREYLSIMEDLGVPINVSKSVVARNATIEFAKVTMTKGQNVSAISWKMFMSQSTLMGRANIVWSLLRKDIVRSNIIRWIVNITSRTRGEKGDIRFTLFAILAMAVNSKLLGIDTLLAHSLDDKAIATQSYKNILAHLDENLLTRFVVRIFAPTEKRPQLPNSEELFASATWQHFAMGFEQVIKSKMHWYMDTLYLNGDCSYQAKAMMQSICPFGPSKAYRYWSTKIDQFDVNFRAFNIIYSHLESLLRKKLFLFPLPTMVMGPGKPTVSGLLEDSDKIDRNLELQQILVRAERKLEKEQKEQLKESVLRDLVNLHKVSKVVSRITIIGCMIPNRRTKRGHKLSNTEAK
jgi:hypothetical protein